MILFLNFSYRLQIFILLNLSLSKSVDGGLTANYVGGYSGPFGIHPDIQDLEFVVIQLSAADGGVSESTDILAVQLIGKVLCKGLDALDWGI
jgi:hypothetical protein